MMKDFPLNADQMAYLHVLLLFLWTVSFLLPSLWTALVAGAVGFVAIVMNGWYFISEVLS